jgi:ABC-2 type transport system permease protein
MNRIFGAIVAVTVREFKRFLRQHGRLISTFARPLLWLAVVGAGFERIVPTAGTVSYLQFLLPGIFGMVILFSTMLSALATVHDREFGPIRMLLVAPIDRWVTVVAKTISSTLIGVFQCVVLFPLIWILGLNPSATQLLQLLGAIILLSLTLSALGMLIASRLRSVENFAGVMNFLLFPMFFLSSALYPAEMLPGYLQPFVRADPLTYGIDLMRYALLSGLYVGNFGSNYKAPFDIAVLVVVTVVLFALAALLFGEEDHLGRILLTDSPRKAKRTRAGWRSKPALPGANGSGPQPEKVAVDDAAADDAAVGVEASLSGQQR